MSRYYSYRHRFSISEIRQFADCLPTFGAWSRNCMFVTPKSSAPSYPSNACISAANGTSSVACLSIDYLTLVFLSSFQTRFSAFGAGWYALKEISRGHKKEQALELLFSPEIVCPILLAFSCSPYGRCAPACSLSGVALSLLWRFYLAATALRYSRRSIWEFLRNSRCPMHQVWPTLRCSWVWVYSYFPIWFYSDHPYRTMTWLQYLRQRGNGKLEILYLCTS